MGDRGVTHKPFDPAALEQSRLYRICLDLMWQIRMSPDHQREGPFASRISQAYINLLAATALELEFEFKPVMDHVMAVDFERWMASPERIAHNEKVRRETI
jgi:hypothetical protein